DFSQSFPSAAQSEVHISLRATVLAGRRLVAQKTFTRTVPAAPNAAGSAEALATASDQVIADMLVWLAAIPASTALP
ncbi:MAG TPA: ABC transporter, partial [Burkholderiaceae bacterium]